jgi:mannose-6-phosphate isomerase-like protein (cupin superfamily)
MDEAPLPFEIDRTCVQLVGDLGARAVPMGPDFWATIGERRELHDGRLLLVSLQTADWDHWERHPSGDEVLYLLSGALDIVLEEGGAQRVLEMRPRTGIIVPRGLWHTGRVRTPGELLSVTPGAGSEHRPA